MQFPIVILVLISGWLSPGAQASLSNPVYEAQRVLRPPLIDGEISDPSWSDTPWSQDFMDIRGPEWPAPIHRTHVKILWDESYLYIAAQMVEPHLWATLTDRDAIVYRDDDLEVFLDPDGDGHAYFEVEINALGTVFDLFLDEPYREGGRAQSTWDLSGLLTGVALQGTLNDPSDEDEGWTVEMAIPWVELIPPGYDSLPFGARSQPTPRDGFGQRTPGRPPDPGDEWRVNFSRVDWPLVILQDPTSGKGIYRKDTRRNLERRAPERRHPEANWVWSPQGEINMHIPEKWGVVRFVDRRLEKETR